MAKYSTGGSSGGGDGDSCELCGDATSDLRRANVAGAELLVCKSCAPHADEPSKRGGSGSSGSKSGGDGEGKRKPKMPSDRSELWDGDTSHWEKEGTGYEKDPLPYLRSGYGDVLTRARQDAGLQTDELAAELDVPEDDILAVEQGRAARAGIGGNLIKAIESHLDVTLVEDA